MGLAPPLPPTHFDVAYVPVPMPMPSNPVRPRTRFWLRVIDAVQMDADQEVLVSGDSLGFVQVRRHSFVPPLFTPALLTACPA
jgi:hypothetical protein